MKTRDIQAVLKNLPDPLIYTDTQGQVLWANPGASKLFPGIKRQASALQVLDHEAVQQAFTQAVADHAPSDVELKWDGPHRRYLKIRFVVFDSDDGESTQVLWRVHDYTAQRQLDKTRTDFIASASHELRTPLASIMGFVETLQGPAKDDVKAREEFLGIMADQAARMSRLIDDLLSLSKIEMEESDTPSDHVMIRDVLASVIQHLSYPAQERGMSIKLSGVSGEQATGDAHQLSQVFSNLIENAIKYAYPNTSIRVSVQVSKTDPTKLSIKVQDCSQGIEAKHIPRLTERFYRVDKARSRQVGGTGLGLAIVKHILFRHAAQLRITSKLGKGSCFEVLLPRVIEANTDDLSSPSHDEHGENAE